MPESMSVSDYNKHIKRVLVTKEEIDEMELLNSEDLSNYVTKEEVLTYVDESELVTYVTENVSEIIKQEINNIAPSDIDGGEEEVWE
jgi:hypothetical protein